MSAENISSEIAKPPCKLPQKRHYRQRAHSNPIADHVFD